MNYPTGTQTSTTGSGTLGGNFGTAEPHSQEESPSLVDKARDVVSSLTEKTKDVASDLVEKTQEAAASVVHGTSEVASRIGHKVEGAACQVKDTIQEGAQYVQQQGVSGMMSDLSHVIRRHP